MTNNIINQFLDYTNLNTLSTGTVELFIPSVKAHVMNVTKLFGFLILLIAQACIISAAHSPSRLHVNVLFVSI